MKRIIEFDERFEFAFLEDSDIKIQHPVSDYYLKLSDLSVNLLISLKWIKWGYIFMKSISKELDNIKKEYTLEKIIIKGIQNFEKIKINEYEKIIAVDGKILNSDEDLENLLENFYDSKIFNENTKVHIKLNLNLREYLLLNNYLFPTFIRIKK